MPTFSLQVLNSQGSYMKILLYIFQIEYDYTGTYLLCHVPKCVPQSFWCYVFLEGVVYAGINRFTFR